MRYQPYQDFTIALDKSGLNNMANSLHIYMEICILFAKRYNSSPIQRSFLYVFRPRIFHIYGAPFSSARPLFVFVYCSNRLVVVASLFCLERFVNVIAKCFAWNAFTEITTAHYLFLLKFSRVKNRGAVYLDFRACLLLDATTDVKSLRQFVRLAGIIYFIFLIIIYKRFLAKCFKYIIFSSIY